MDYTLVITTPDTGRTAFACATMTDVTNQIVHFVRYNTENSFVIETVFNID